LEEGHVTIGEHATHRELLAGKENESACNDMVKARRVSRL